MALLVAHYDVLAGIQLGGEVSPCTMGERLLEGPVASDLLLYDRGFPSYVRFSLCIGHTYDVNELVTLLS